MEIPLFRSSQEGAKPFSRGPPRKNNNPAYLLRPSYGCSWRDVFTQLVLNLVKCEHLPLLSLLLNFQVKSGTIFDNILITDSEEYAEEVGNETWGATKDPEKKMKDQVKDVA